MILQDMKTLKERQGMNMEDVDSLLPRLSSSDIPHDIRPL